MAKKELFDEDDSGNADGTDLKINEDYARRFEHNKKREERQRRKSYAVQVFCETAPTIDVERNRLRVGRNRSDPPNSRSLAFPPRSQATAVSYSRM